MQNLLCNLAIKTLTKYKRSVIINYQIRGDIRPTYNNPIIGGHFHIIGRLYKDDGSDEIF